MHIPFSLQFNISKKLSIKKTQQCKFNQCSRSTKKAWNLLLHTYRNTNVVIYRKIKDVESKYLIYLDLGDNQLTSLPASIKNLQNLTYLYLHNNQLTSLPDAVGNLQNLTELDLTHNQLTSLQKNKIKEIFQNKETNILI